MLRLLRKTLLCGLASVLNPYFDNYADWYLTKPEQARLGPMGVASANIMVADRTAIDELVFNSPDYGMDRPMLDTSMPTGCMFCFYILAFR